MTDSPCSEASSAPSSPLRPLLASAAGLQPGRGGVIAGRVQGVPGMREGGKRRLHVPRQLTCGETGTPLIPPRSDLVFEIELITIE